MRGADDQNECTAAVLDYLRSIAELEVFDDSDKWPEFAQHVGRAVAEGDADYGVVMCWTGTGTSIAANKVKGVSRLGLGSLDRQGGAPLE